MATMQMKPVEFFKADPKNPRTSADETDLDHLGDDMLARGVLVPLLAKPDGTIIDGWRRWLAAQRKGIKELPVIITDKPEKEIKGIQLATVFHRADLTGHEKYLACAELMSMNPGFQLKDVAEFLHLGAPTITKLLSPSRCIPAWQEALRDGKVGISDCYAASGLPEAEQGALLGQKLAGASRDDIVRAARRKSRNSNTPSVKVSKVKIAMPQATVVLSGKDLSMSRVVDLLTETLKEARKAADQYDVKTWQSMMRDKSKGGA